jgi:ferredoxin
VPHGRIVIDAAQCKGCNLCVDSCPKACIRRSTEINRLGYCYAVFASSDCTACGFCFYVCPEPDAITVYKDRKP